MMSQGLALPVSPTGVSWGSRASAPKTKPLSNGEGGVLSPLMAWIGTVLQRSFGRHELSTAPIPAVATMVWPLVCPVCVSGPTDICSSGTQDSDDSESEDLLLGHHRVPYHSVPCSGAVKLNGAKILSGTTMVSDAV